MSSDAKPFQCPYCSKRLRDESGRYSHVKSVHPTKKRAHLRPGGSADESMASVVVNAYLKRAMGEPLDPLEESLLQ